MCSNESTTKQETYVVAIDDMFRANLRMSSIVRMSNASRLVANGNSDGKPGAVDGIRVAKSLSVAVEKGRGKTSFSLEKPKRQYGVFYRVCTYKMGGHGRAVIDSVAHSKGSERVAK